jgi:hypothetical protein
VCAPSAKGRSRVSSHLATMISVDLITAVTS